MMPAFRLPIQAILLFLIAMFFFLAPTSSAFAQRKNISGHEMTLLAFYKLTGLEPDFKEWVYSNPVYQDMSETSKVAAEMFMEEELLRLQWGLGTIEPEKAFIHIETDIIGKVISKDGKNYLAIAFPDRRKRKEPYFPYSVGDLWVAVIMKDINDFMIMELDAEQYQRITEYTPRPAKPFKLKIKITYRGISAETKPLIMDGHEQYIMLGEIAHWNVIAPSQSRRGVSVWDHIEPWYRTEDEDELIRMLKGE